jgi:uncharacterized damage-inducible protein DinB
MKEPHRIADQLARSLRGDAWHGPSLSELLEDVSAEDAARHPVPGAHSIGELVLHVAVWQDVIRRRLTGDSRALTDEENWRGFAGGDDAWREAKDSLRNSTELLMTAASALAESDLDEPILPGYSTRYVSLHGAVQHNLYHAGQIALLKRALAASR